MMRKGEIRGLSILSILQKTTHDLALLRVLRGYQRDLDGLDVLIHNIPRSKINSQGDPGANGNRSGSSAICVGDHLLKMIGVLCVGDRYATHVGISIRRPVGRGVIVTIMKSKSFSK